MHSAVCVQSVQWIMGTVVWSDLYKSVWCERQCREKTTSGGEQTEVHGQDSRQYPT